MLSQIEQALLRCNGDKFALLCRQFLFYQFPNVFSTGFVLGKEKSRIGHPDILIPAEKKYIFCEITTVSKGLEKKLLKDISDCFTQNDIPSNKILQILLICNSKVPTALHEKLHLHIESFNSEANLEVIDIDNFANRIYRDYRAIAHELGVPIDTGQIFETVEFIDNYDKSGFAVSLKNTFHNRSSELNSAYLDLEKTDIIMITGEPGVGKTKFSIELTKQFTKTYRDFKVKYISANGDLTIWNDLKCQLLPDQKYLLVLDDANKMKRNLEQIKNFIIGRKESGKIKIIITVRNYLRKEAEEYFDILSILELKQFTHGELRQILQSSEFDVRDYYIDRIYSISKGNPRLALMAYRAVKNNKIDEINDASKLYDHYFSSILNTTNGLLNDKTTLQVAGLLSLYRNIDFTAQKTIDTIVNDFGISNETLLEHCIKLSKFEIADEYENIFKISDQILGEYLFYKVFIDKKILPFNVLLNMAYDGNLFGLIHTLTPIISNYGFESIKTRILIDIKEKWKQIDCEDKAFRFLKDFWFYLPSETLKFLRDYINRMQTNDYNNFKLEVYKDNHIASYDDRIIEILINFKDLPQKFDIAHQLLLNYAKKSELIFSKVLKTYLHTFTYGRYSQEIKYTTQIQTINFLYTKIDEEKIFFSRILLFIAPSYLKDSLQIFRGENSSLEIGERTITLTEEQNQFRRTLFEFIFKSFDDIILRKEVYDTLQSYIQNINYHFHEKEVINFDKQIIIAFVKRKFSTSDYTDCFLLNLYAQYLKWVKISLDVNLLRAFNERKFQLYLTLNEDRIKRKEYGGDDYEKLKRIELQELINGYGFEEYCRLFSDLQYILTEGKRFSRDASILESFNTILELLSISDRELFFRCLPETFQYEFAKKMELYRLFKAFRFDQDYAARIRSQLYQNSTGRRYLMNFWFFLPQEFFVKEDWNILLKLIRDNSFETFWNIEKIIVATVPYCKDEKESITDILDELIIRLSDHKKTYLEASFFHYINDNFPELFSERISDISKIYIRIDRNSSFDYNLKLLRVILQYDITFIREYLNENFKNDSYSSISRREISDSYLHKLWKMDADHISLFTIIMDHFKEKVLLWSDLSSEVTILFQDKSQIQLNFLKVYLQSRSDEDAIRLVFNIITSVFREHKFEFLEIILSKENELEVFKRLSFHVRYGITHSGSFIPQLREEINEYEAVKEYLENKSTLDYIDHIAYLEERIFHCHLHIEREVRDEYLKSRGF